MADNLKYIILSVGHSPSNQAGTQISNVTGALKEKAKSLGFTVSNNIITEFGYNLVLCNKIQTLINEKTSETGVFAYLSCREQINGVTIPNYKGDNYGKFTHGVAITQSFINKNPGKVAAALEFHLNAGMADTNYSRFLTGLKGDSKNDNLHKHIEGVLRKTFGNVISKYNRLDPNDPEQRAGMGWARITGAAAMLIEPFFTEDRKSCEIAILQVNEIAAEYAKALINYATGVVPELSISDLNELNNPVYSQSVTPNAKFSDDQIKNSATETQNRILYYESQLGTCGNHYEISTKNKYTSIGCGTFTAKPYRVDPRGASISRPFVRETGIEGYDIISPTYEYVDVVSSMPVGHHTEQVAGHHKMAAFETTIASTGWTRMAGSFVDIGGSKQVSLTGNQVALTSGGSLAIAAPMTQIQSDSFGVKGMLNIDGKAMFNGMIYAGESISTPQLNVVGVNEDSAETVAGVKLAGEDSAIGGTLIQSRFTSLEGGTAKFDNVKGTISVKVVGTNTGLKPADASKNDITQMTLEISGGELNALLTEIVTNLFQSHNWSGFMDKFTGCGPEGAPMVTHPHSHQYVRPQGMMADSIDSLNSTVGPVINNSADNRKQVMSLKTGEYSSTTFA